MLNDFRKDLHKHPELSGKEFETAAKIYDQLKLLRPDKLIKGLGGTGLLAIFGDDPKQKTVCFRAELDALPITEVNDFEHQSIHHGIAHKCGHDGHATILLGLAQKAMAERSNLGVNVAVLFQPAEETCSGAIAVLKDPNFEGFKLDYIFALHNCFSQI